MYIYITYDKHLRTYARTVLVWPRQERNYSDSEGGL